MAVDNLALHYVKGHDTSKTSMTGAGGVGDEFGRGSGEGGCSWLMRVGAVGRGGVST